MVILLSEGAAAMPRRDRLAGLVNAMHIDNVLARAATARTSAGSAEVPLGGRRPAAPTIGSSPPGSPGLRRLASGCRGGGRILDESSWQPLPPRGRLRTGLPALLDRASAARTRPALAPPLARALRSCRLADHPGLLAADVAAGGAGRTDRDLDLPTSTAADTASADRQLGQPPTPVELAAVRITVARVREPEWLPVVGVCVGQWFGLTVGIWHQTGGGRPTSSGTAGATNTRPLKLW
jgi:hypothetical protein